MSETPEDILDDGPQVATMLKFSAWTVTKWSNRKKDPLPCVRLGHRTKRYSRNAVLAWIAAQGGKKS